MQERTARTRGPNAQSLDSLDATPVREGALKTGTSSRSLHDFLSLVYSLRK